MLNDLSEALMVEIFSRIQMKSILRFRSVSKSLHACIGSPGFIRLHTLRSPKTIMIKHLTRYERGVGACAKRVYTLHSEDQLSRYPYTGITPIEYPFKTFTIGDVGSCNGIICVYEIGVGIHLWNPSLRRKVTVDDCPYWGFCSHVIGFGFDPIMDDYKILSTSNAGSFVYTMKTRTWREITSPTARFSLVNKQQCVFKGALHWVVKRYLADYYYLMKFDMSSEVFSVIELPEPSWKTAHVTIIKGCLAVISSKHDHSCIWVRRGYDNTASWFVALKLNRNTLFKGAKRVVEHGTNGGLLVHHYSKGILVYNPEKRNHFWRVKDFSSYIAGLSRSYIAGLSMCVESLELLDVGTSCDKNKIK